MQSKLVPGEVAAASPCGSRSAEFALVIFFLTLLASGLLIQTTVELRRGEGVGALDVFRQKPTSANLRAYERNLEDASVVARALRPWFQFAQFAWLRDGGGKALVGRNGWLFYKPGYDDMLARPTPSLHQSTNLPVHSDPVAAIVAWRDALAARGIQLLVVPVPNKESIYPDQLTRRVAPGQSVISPTTRGVLARLNSANVECLDLFALFAEARTNTAVLLRKSQERRQFLPPHPGPLPRGEGEPFAALRQAERARLVDAQAAGFPLSEGEGQGEGERNVRSPTGLAYPGDFSGRAARLYLAQDSHWSPAGVELAAEAVARRLIERGWARTGTAEYRERPAAVERRGDVLQMLQSPAIERRVTPEKVPCSQVMRADTGQPYQDDTQSEVLILGDSFLRIYEQDEPGSAGFIAHLAKALRQPLTSLVSDGGASTLVRQELFRRPALLKNKRVVVWEFAERDIRLGAEGWQNVPLPPNEPASQTARHTE
ncbi:MAG: hypothetical protein HY735_15625 [Verrucomicrobia bacterium]|nr:hypothetical protein [Verrucomicrobiota bacterium]